MVRSPFPMTNIGKTKPSRRSLPWKRDAARRWRSRGRRWRPRRSRTRPRTRRRRASRREFRKPTTGGARMGPHTVLSKTLHHHQESLFDSTFTRRASVALFFCKFLWNFI